MDAYERLARQDLFRRAGQLAARTLIIDVEPLVASWDTSQDLLDRGVAVTLAQAASLPEVRVVCFATNSARTPSAVPASEGVRVLYLASARKPLSTDPYREPTRAGSRDR
jgi:hypothetical protein